MPLLIVREFVTDLEDTGSLIKVDSANSKILRTHHLLSVFLKQSSWNVRFNSVLSSLKLLLEVFAIIVEEFFHVRAPVLSVLDVDITPRLAISLQCCSKDYWSHRFALLNAGSHELSDLSALEVVLAFINLCLELNFTFFFLLKTALLTFFSLSCFFLLFGFFRNFFLFLLRNLNNFGAFWCIRFADATFGTWVFLILKCACTALIRFVSDNLSAVLFGLTHRLFFFFLFGFFHRWELHNYGDKLFNCELLRSLECSLDL